MSRGHQDDALVARCDWCGAEPGDPCRTTEDAPMAQPHKQRARGQPPPAARAELERLRLRVLALEVGRDSDRKETGRLRQEVRHLTAQYALLSAPPRSAHRRPATTKTTGKQETDDA